MLISTVQYSRGKFVRILERMNISYRQLSIVLLFLTSLLVSSDILSCATNLDDRHGDGTVEISFTIPADIADISPQMLLGSSHHEANHQSMRSGEEKHSHGDCECCDDCRCYNCAGCDSCGSSVTALSTSIALIRLSPASCVCKLKPSYVSFTYPPPGYPPRN